MVATGIEITGCKWNNKEYSKQDGVMDWTEQKWKEQEEYNSQILSRKLEGYRAVCLD